MLSLSGVPPFLLFPSLVLLISSLTSELERFIAFLLRRWGPGSVILTVFLWDPGISADNSVRTVPLVVTGGIGLPTSINILIIPCISVVTSILTSIYTLVAAAVSLILAVGYYIMGSGVFTIITTMITIIYPGRVGLTSYSSCRTSNSLPIPSSSFIWFQFNR
jgi:hypothetical protein